MKKLLNLSGGLARTLRGLRPNEAFLNCFLWARVVREKITEGAAAE